MQDVTERLNPYLISVQVVDSIEGGHSEAHIELDDRYCELIIPPDDVPLTVMMGWSGEGPRVIDFGRGANAMEMTAEEKQQEMKWDGPGLEVVFAGWVSEVESGFGRKGGGRRMWISGTGGNTKGEAKTLQNVTVGEGKQDDSVTTEDGTAVGPKGGGGGGGGGKHPLNEIATKVFSNAGLQFKMSPGMQSIKRDFWQAANESAQNFGERIARETGGVFSINNGIATLVGKGEGVNADGVKMFGIEAVWGVNLIGWRIKPFSGRAQYGKAQSKFFDIMKANWDHVAGEVPGGNPFGGASAVAHNIGAVIGKIEGGQTNEGASKDSQAKRGTGWVLLNGEPRAHANCRISINGARPGVDGSYTVSEAEHNYTRGVGYTTRCNVQSFSPKEGDYNWPKAPPPVLPQSTDPTAPGYVPAPPISGPQTYTEEEKARMRQWYIDHGQADKIPEWILSNSDAAKLKKMREDRELKRQEDEAQLGADIGDILGQIGNAGGGPVLPPPEVPISGPNIRSLR